MRKARFWEARDGKADCRLCPNHCSIAQGRRGLCLGRGNSGGEMALYNYARVVAANLDPIEKKPLYHFFPGSAILSVGTFGCNLACRFCQNYDISQSEVPGQIITPGELADRSAATPGNIGVAFTYNEPGVWFEYIMDCAPLLEKRNQQVVLVTNGYLEDKPWAELCRVTQAMNIDLKSFRDEFYREVCHGKLAQVLRNIESAWRAGVHVELTNLVVTGLNDDQKDFEKLVDWVASLSTEIPLHLSRYFPRFKESAPPTEVTTLEAFFEVARRKLHYVFVGNCATAHGQDSLCPNCGAVLIERRGYNTVVKIEAPTCSCGKSLPIRGLRS